VDGPVLLIAPIDKCHIASLLQLENPPVYHVAAALVREVREKFAPKLTNVIALARVIRSAPGRPRLAGLRNCHYHSGTETYDVSRDLYIDNSRRYLFTSIRVALPARCKSDFGDAWSSIIREEAAGAVTRETHSPRGVDTLSR